MDANSPNLSFQINFDVLPDGTGKLINFEGRLAISPELGIFEISNVEDSFVTFGAIEMKAKRISAAQSIGYAMISLRGDRFLKQAAGSILYVEEDITGNKGSYSADVICK